MTMAMRELFTSRNQGKENPHPENRVGMGAEGGSAGTYLFVSFGWAFTILIGREPRTKSVYFVAGKHGPESEREGSLSLVGCGLHRCGHVELGALGQDGGACEIEVVE